MDIQQGERKKMNKIMLILWGVLFTTSGVGATLKEKIQILLDQQKAQDEEWEKQYTRLKVGLGGMNTGISQLVAKALQLQEQNQQLKEEIAILSMPTLPTTPTPMDNPMGRTPLERSMTFYEHEEEIDLLQQKLKEMVSALDAQKQKTAKIAKERDFSQGRVSELQATVQKLEEELKEEYDANHELPPSPGASVSPGRQEHDTSSLSTIIRQQTQIIEELQRERDELKRQLEELEQADDALFTREQELEKTDYRLEHEKALLQAQLSRERADEEAALQEKDELIDYLQQRCRELESEKANYLQDVQRLEERASHKIQQVEDLQKTLIGKEEDLIEARNAIRELQREKRELRDALESEKTEFLEELKRNFELSQLGDNHG